MGIELVDIPMEELLDTISATPMDFSSRPDDAFPMANRIYEALKTLLQQQNLQGFTLRCFDLLNTVHNTGCWALAKLNSEGYIAGCEGDIPALLSMTIAHAVTGISGFLANPATINPETGEILLAHCTIPFNMVQRYELYTHFESGIGIGIRGFMNEGPVTVFKVSGDLRRHYLAKGVLKMSLALPNLCRTQQLIQLNHHGDIDYFLNDPIGNHHIVLPGHQDALLKELLKGIS
jgi:L-fucose isomerase-like protein